MPSNCGAGGDLRIPWTARRSNKSVLIESNSEYSLEELLLKLRLQYSGHLMRRANSLEKTLILRKIEGITSLQEKHVYLQRSVKECFMAWVYTFFQKEGKAQTTYLHYHF